MRPVHLSAILGLAALSLLLGCDTEPDKSTPTDPGGEDDSDAGPDGDDEADDEEGDEGDTDDPTPVTAALLPLEETGPRLTELATEAVAASPAWLRDDLTLAFLRVDDRIANELGQERAVLAQLPRLNMILENVRSRLVRLELDVADPPTQVRSAGR